MNPGYVIRPTDDFKGIGLFATRVFKESETIFEEQPIIAAQFSWNEDVGYAACHHCLRPLETAQENIRRLTQNNSIVIPHPELCPTNKALHVSCQVCNTKFCCEDCKTLAWNSYHQFLCYGNSPKLRCLVEQWKEMHYPPETTSIMLIAKIIGVIEQSSDREAALNEFLKFCNSAVDEDEGLLLRFLGPQFSNNLESLQRCFTEVMPNAHCKSLFSDEGMKTLLALVGRNGQGIGTSIYSVYVQKVEELKVPQDEEISLDTFIQEVYDAMNKCVGIFLNVEGSGLFKTQRCINHSCSPNAQVGFPKNNYTLVLEALKDIQPGDEICISYLDECELGRSRHSRQTFLRENYLFICKCSKCLEQADDPDVTSEEEDEEDSESMDV